MARKKSKTNRPAAPSKKPSLAPPALNSSVQDEPSNQPKPTNTTPILDSVKNECEQALDAFPVRKYWKTLSVEKRRSFLEVSFHDLRAHYASEDDGLAVDVISEALSYAKHSNTLKFWVCRFCSRGFNDCESHKQHVWAHIGNLAAKFWELLPKVADSGSVDMIRSNCWKPVDFNAAMKILENQATRQSLTTADTINQRWPLIEDPKRAKHLESIQSMFQLLLRHKCLADNHVKTVIQRAMNELQKLAPGLELLDHRLDETLACVCFLGADKLPNIFLYLHYLSKSCQLGKDSEKVTSVDDNHGVDNLVSAILEGIELSDDSNHLILNEFLLAAGTVSNKAENAAISEDGEPNWDDLLDGIFRPFSTDVELESWTFLREDRGYRGMEILQKLKEEFDLLQRLCERKFKRRSYMGAFSDLEDLCLEEVRRREHSVENAAQSWEAVLRKRQEELTERKDDPVLIDIERDAISTVLKEYRASIVTSSNKEDSRMEENLHQVDERLVEVIGKQKLFSSLEMGGLDARIMQKSAAIQQLEHELEAISTIDYREILLLLVKKHLRARLKDLAVLDDATEKSNAAAQALLAEEAESNVNKGGDDSKQIQEKSKKKRKKKGCKRAKDLKGVGWEKEIASQQETEEQITLVGATDVDQRESEFVASVDDLKGLEEDLKADERKLEENLHYQSRIENEDKQKRLADKSVVFGLPKDSVGLHTGSVERTEIPGPSNQGISADGLSPSVRQTHSQNPTSLSQIEGCFKEQTHQWVDPHQEDNETKALGKLSAEEHDEERFQADITKSILENLGPSNQGISEDGLSPSGRQAHNQNPTSDGHSQTLSEKENHEASPSQTDDEKFQADLTKAVQESLGPSNQGILDDGLSPSGRKAHTSDGHSQTLSEKENEASLSHQWVDPHLGDNETKELGQLSVEEHDVERFQADHTKAALESLGPSNHGISEDGLSLSGRQAHSQNPTSDGHSQTLPKKENHEDSPPQIDEERFQADLTKAVQESLEPRKIMDPAHNIIAVRKYWNVLSIKKKLSLLLVSHHDLRAHYASEEDGLAVDVLSEALSFIESNKTWKFWACCLCGEKFADSESHKQHVWVHIGGLLLKLQPVLPKEPDSGWAEMLLNGCWEPVDLHASIKILENRLRHDSLTTADSSDVGTHTNGSNRDCSCEFFSTIALLLNKICLFSKRKRVFSPDERGFKDSSEVQELDGESKAGVVYRGDLSENGNCSGISSSDLRGDGNKHWVEAYLIPQSWPLVDDPKRAKLLDGIHGMFQLLLKHKCLADTHLKKVIHYTMDELQGLAPGLQLPDHGLDQTAACIRFLDATQLQNVLDLLQELSNSCQLRKDSEKITSADDTQGVNTLVIDVLEGINLSGDSSHLISNEFLLTAGSNKAENASMGEEVSVLSEDGEPGGDAFLSWLFASSSADVEAVSWTHLREDKSRRGKEILQELDEEFNYLKKLCQEKCEHLCYMEALCSLLDLCHKEFKKRHHSMEYVAQSFEALLRKRQEELVESKDNPVFINSRFEENAISLVLKGEEDLNVIQCGQPGLTSHLCDLESSKKKDSRTQDNLYQSDKSILLGVRTHGRKFSLELCTLDARIRQNLAGMQQLEHELGTMSSFDYWEILFFLIRPLWRAHLEDLVDRCQREI